MENIPTNAQIPKHSLMLRVFHVLIYFLLFFGGVAQAQKLSTENKKGIKKYQKAQEAVIDRDFTAAKGYFKDAIRLDEGFLEPYLKLAGIYSIYQQNDSARIYYQLYVDHASPEKISWSIWKKLAYLNFEAGQYDKANDAIAKLIALKPEYINDPELKRIHASVIFSLHAATHPHAIKVKRMPDEINRFGLQYFPVLTIDERTMIYTKRDSDHMSADEDIVFSMKTDSGWSVSKSISDQINSDQNEGACTVSADGRILIFTSCDNGRTYGSCDLFISYKEGDSWSKSENMGAVVNSSSWDSQPSLSADGRTLYFASNRPGGFGKRDLWVTYNGEKGWTKPENLGEQVNRFLDETAPSIHASGDVLFFSSTSHPGLGGYDLFYTRKQNNIWGKVVNISYPINTHHDEISIYPTPDGRYAFYAQESQKAGRVVKSEIVKAEFLEGLIEASRTSYITGVVFDEETQSPLHADIRLMNMQDSLELYHAQSDPSTGRYFLAITAEKEYGLFVDKKNYLFDNLSIAATDNTALTPDTINIGLRPLVDGQSIVLQNLYFDFDSYKLTEKSRHELKRLIHFLNINPDLKFEIEGHTDAEGEKVYNDELSQKRAEEVVSFLVSAGISKSRMRAIGYGSSKPVILESSSSQTYLNRRIVFRVLK